MPLLRARRSTQASDTSTTSSGTRRRSYRDPLVGAAAGALLWTGIELLGIPELAGGPWHDLVLVAAVLGALFALTRLRWVLYTKTILVAVIVAVIAYTPIAERAVRSLVRRDPVPAVPSGAVVVLGADVTPDSLLFGQSLERMLTAVELMKGGTAPVLVIPGNVLEERGRRVSARADQLRLIALAGADTNTVLVADSVYSTRDEAERARTLLRTRNIRRIHVVTSPAHSGRACRTFERVGFVVTCTPSTSRVLPFTPGTMYRSSDRLLAFRLWLYERAAFQVYHMKGWI